MNKDEINLKTIKLIIWDLDNTLWKGILTEGNITDIKTNYDFVKKLTDVGIINSICSKNDLLPVEKELERIGLSEYFVFKSINWETKGYRVKKIIENMHLRPINVLFIDDDKRNLEEVKNKLPEINCILPDNIPMLMKQLDCSFKTDNEHKRLNQYKILEKKFLDSKEYGKDTDFLKSCDIKIFIGRDCKQQFDRIYELMQRSNQLNYTKVRLSENEFKMLLSDDKLECAYISCKDKYGDYGIVGFYALDAKHNSLIHFFFSCRTLGMGVENYVYNILKKPKLEFNGYVVNDLTEPCPDWIKISDTDFIKESDKPTNATKQINILFKGPCDLYLVEKFFPKNLHIKTEFTFMNERSFGVESFNHTSEIVASFKYSNEQKKELINSLPFMAENYYDTRIFNGSWQVVILSMLCDYSLGMYCNKNDGTQFVYGQYTQNLIDENNYEYYTKKTTPKIEKKFLEGLRENYIYKGIITKSEMKDNLLFIRNQLPDKTLLILLGGAEYNYQEKGSDIRKNRYLVHKEYNETVKEFCQQNKNCAFIDVNPFIKDNHSFIDTISHYTNEVYFQIAQSIISIINEWTGTEVLHGISIKTYKKMKFYELKRHIAMFIPISFRIFIKKILKMK